MRLKDLVGKMAIRTAEPFSIVPPSGVVGFGLHGERWCLDSIKNIWTSQ